MQNNNFREFSIAAERSERHHRLIYECDIALRCNRGILPVFQSVYMNMAGWLIEKVVYPDTNVHYYEIG